MPDRWRPHTGVAEVIAEIGVPRATFYRWRQLHKGLRSIELPSRDLRKAFLWAVLPVNDGAQPPADLDEALRWLRQHALPLKAIADPSVTRRVIHQLTITLEGRPAAEDTYRRQRRGLNAAIEYAVELGQLPENPLKRVKTRRVAVQDYVDPRGRHACTSAGAADRSVVRRLVA